MHEASNNKSGRNHVQLPAQPQCVLMSVLLATVY